MEKALALGADPLRRRDRVVRHVLADAFEIDAWLDASLTQLVGRADARKQQQLRRVERAAGEDHLALGMRPVLLPILHVFDADGTRTVEEDARRMAAGDKLDIAAFHRGAQIGDCGARAPAVADRVLSAAEALLL